MSEAMSACGGWAAKFASGILVCATVTGSLANAGASQAETLHDALEAAYRTNPLLVSQREQQKALDETYVQAEAGWRPTAGLTLSAQYERGPNALNDFRDGSSSANFGTAGITVSQPLYTGGRTIWAVRGAKASVDAGREALRATEAQVLFGVVQGYLDVLRDQRILAIRNADLATLTRQAAEARAKFNLGQITRTDVAQAEAQLASAQGALAAATGQLEVSRAEYEAVVGTPAGALADTQTIPGLPTTLGEALDVAKTSSPALSQSQEQERASRAAIAEARAARRPTVSLQGMYGYIGPLSPLNTRDYGQDVTGGITVSLPIVTGGVTGSQIRQATDRNSSDEAIIELTRRQVVQTVTQMWAQFQANAQAARAAETQEAAADLALKGVQLEYGFGLRTTLDVLIADESLRAAQATLATSRHDAILSQAAVLQAIGRLEVLVQLPEVARYDPNENFNRVKNAGSLLWEGAIRSIDSIGAPASPSR